MDIESRCRRLESIYTVYDAFIAATDRACRRHCACCCTCNVTGTTLEGWLLHERLAAGAAEYGLIMEKLPQTAPGARFRPKLTINEMVRFCLQDQALPEEQNDPGAGNCPFLDGDTCSIYAVRPFGCRAMLSTIDCAIGEQAHMPPLILSANNVVMQYIEALDRPGASGNMIDILLFLSDPGRRRAYETRQPPTWPRSLRANQPFPALMIPPEHRAAIQPLLQSLKKSVEVGG